MSAIFWVCFAIAGIWFVGVLWLLAIVASAGRADRRTERRRVRQAALRNGQSWLSAVPPRHRIPTSERAEIRDLADRMIEDVECRVRHEFGGERLPS